jgi:chromosome segregation ATPase
LDPIVIVLATAAGTLIGTSVGILLLRRKLRPPITDAELAELKGKLQTGESSLAAASANLEDLRKQIALQERTLLQNGEDLKKRQEQLDIESAETQKEKARRFAAEHSVQEGSAKAVLLTEQCMKLEARVKEENNRVAEKTTRLVSFEAELEAEKRKIQEMTEQVTRLASESAELKRFGEQETRLRTALEAQLRADQERIRQLTSQIAELQNEQLQLETKLQEERDSAARGMELLFTVQEKLSSAFKALGADGQNGHHSQAPVEAAVDGVIRPYR